MKQPPILAVFVDVEGPVCVRVFADSYEDEIRMVVDAELRRPDLLDEIAIAIDEFLIAAYERGDLG